MFDLLGFPPEQFMNAFQFGAPPIMEVWLWFG
jgi:hypothetical protein